MKSIINIEESLAATHHQNAEGAVKTVEDLARYEEALKRSQPDIILECGTFSGGSAAWFQRFAPVVTIDIDMTHLEQRHLNGWNDRVRFLCGSTVDDEIVSTVHEICWQRKVFLTLDSDHSGPHVYKEILAYSALVPVGGYMVVEDTLVRWMEGPYKTAYDGSPLDAVEWFLSDNGDWENDLTIENMSTQSQHVGGWLRRLA